MAGILGDNDFLRKSEEIARLVSGDEPQASGIKDEQILLKDFKLRGIDPRVGLTGALAELKAGLKMYRKGNTIMAVKKLSPNAAQMHFFTMDKEEAFRQYITFWIQEFKKLGGQVIYDTVADPHIIRALQAVGAQVQPSDVPKFKMKAMV
jgi:hypothetical protein